MTAASHDAAVHKQTAVDYYSMCREVTEVIMAAYVLDPRLRSDGLNEDEWITACESILHIANPEKLDRDLVLSDYAQYKSRSGNLFGKDFVWEAAVSGSCHDNPQLWWSSYVSSRELSKVARIVLSMPATAAVIERCNKAYASTKSKSRNRLSCTRAAKLAMVAYNRKVQHCQSSHRKRSARRSQRTSILSLPFGPCTASVTDGVGVPSDSASNRAEHDVAAACLIQNLIQSSHHSDCDSDIDSATECSEVNEQSDSDLEDEVGLLPVKLLQGDWVAVKVGRDDNSTKASKGKSKINASKANRECKRSFT